VPHDRRAPIDQLGVLLTLKIFSPAPDREPLQIAAGARSFSTIRGGKLYGAR
jgi:hypothetical protein